VLIDAHAGFPRWIGSGADFIEIDVRRDQRGVIIDAHDEPRPGAKHATLDEVLHALDSRAGLHLDMKETGYEVELLTRVLQALPPLKVVATPDFEESVRVIKANSPTSASAPSTSSPSTSATRTGPTTSRSGCGPSTTKGSCGDSWTTRASNASSPTASTER